MKRVIQFFKDLIIKPSFMERTFKKRQGEFIEFDGFTDGMDFDFGAGGIQPGHISVTAKKRIDAATIPPNSDVDLEARDSLINQIEKLIITRRSNYLTTDDFPVPFKDQILFIEPYKETVKILRMQSDINNYDSIVYFTGKPYPIRKWFIENVLTYSDYIDLEKTLINIM